jgi:hypothetical protein
MRGQFWIFDVYSFNLRQIGRRTEGQMGIEGRREKMRSGE